MGKEYRINLNEGGNRAAFTKTEEISEEYKLSQYLGIDSENADKWALYIPNNSEFLKQLSEKLSAIWNLVEKSENHIKAVQELINPTIDEKFTEVIRRDSSLFVRKEANGKGFYVNIKDLGEGIKKVLNIFLFIELCSPKLILWDDFEVAAHPSLIKSLLTWLIGKEWQVVLATHSIDVIYELAKMQPADAQVIQLKKKDGDILTHAILTSGQIKDYLDAGSDPRLLVDAIQ